MRTVARIVTRMQGEGDGLFLGTLTKEGKEFLQPSSVYEVIEFDGNFLFRRKGEAAPAKEGETVNASPLRAHWSSEIGYLISRHGKYLFLTREELEQLP